MNILRIDILGPPLGCSRGGDEIRRNQSIFSSEGPGPPVLLPSSDASCAHCLDQLDQSTFVFVDCSFNNCARQLFDHTDRA